MAAEHVQGAGQSYLALPASGSGPGVLVLHAWWGLTPFFRALCDRLAAAGFVALAPDLYGGGKTAATVDEAQALIDSADGEVVYAAAAGALAALASHPAVTPGGVGLVGFSMGAAWGLLISTTRPEEVRAAVIFYGNGEGDFARARAAYLGHFAPGDPWEPDEGIEELEQRLRGAGREATFHHYPDTSHWFFEENRPEYNPEAAQLAWERTLAFLREQLATQG
jgi:carboxymethylenebutenolidase